MDVLLQEIEALEAILLDDVTIQRNPDTDCPELIETTIFPNVGENVDQQYVCVTLAVIFSKNYPDEEPKFKLRNPRGLSDCSLANIEKAIVEKLVESVGQPVVFDLIEVVREHLTESNTPTGLCVICLYGFCEGDQFTKTVCYHYLHSHCLASHLTASKRNYEEEVAKLPAWQQKEAKKFSPFCPVCRELLEDIDIEPLLASKPPQDLENAPDFIVTNELKSLQKQMSRLYLHQKQRGGIIDLEAEEAVLSLGLEEQEVTGGARNLSQTAPQQTNNRNSQVNQAARLRNQQLAASKNRALIEKDNSEEDSEKDTAGGGRNRHSKNHRGKHFHHRHRFAHNNGKAPGAATASDQPATSSTNIPNASGGKNR